MDPATRRVLRSAEFQRLVVRRWTVSLALTACLFALYYGFILLIGLNKPFLAARIGKVITRGIPIGMGVIVGAWMLTAVYVLWANRRYDADVRTLREQVDR